MTDLQEVAEAFAQNERMDTFAETGQLTLGELTLLFENVDDEEKPVYFDDTEYFPSSLGSWRGAYRELAIRYDKSDEYDAPTAESVLEMLEDADGSEYTGYKGGQFTMTGVTPVWVANRGSTDGFISPDGLTHQGVVAVEETDDRVNIQTAEVDF